MILSIPLIMVSVFFIVTLAVGFYFSGKTSTLRAYAVGNKQFATATLVATVMATNFGGGGLVRTVEQVYTKGIYWILYLTLSYADIWMTTYLATRMGPFMQHLSIAESIGSIYGNIPRLITALFCICTEVASVAIQINVMSLAINMCIDGVNPQMVSILAAATLIFYSAFGGIRAVTFTDVLQFLTFSIIIPLFAWFIFKTMDTSIHDIALTVQRQPNFQLGSVLHWDYKLLGMVALLLSNLTSLINPSTMQRVYMCFGPMQAKKVFLYSGILGFIIQLIIISVGIFVFVWCPSLQVKEIWPYIILHMPPILKGLLAISLLAMAMSTADSSLNSCAVMVSHDIVKSIQKIQLPYMHSCKMMRYSAKALRFFALPLRIIPDSHPLLLTKISSIAVGLSAMAMSFYCHDLLQLMLLSFTLSIPIITAPFVLAVFGFRGSTHAALIGMTTGVISILCWNQWIEPKTDIDGSFVSMLANGLAMIVAHYLLPGPGNAGWTEPDEEYQQIAQEKQRKNSRRMKAIKGIFTKENFVRIKPTHAQLLMVGMYIIFTSLFVLGIIHAKQWVVIWFIFQIIIGACCIGYVAFASFLHKTAADWIIGKYWLMSLIVCFPIGMIVQCWHTTDYLFTETLILAHLVMAFWVVPTSLGMLITIPLLAGYLFCFTKAIKMWHLGIVPFYLLGLRLLSFIIMIAYKRKTNVQELQIAYLKTQEQLRKQQKLKKIAYNFNINHADQKTEIEGDSGILQKVIQDVTQSITFLDEHPLYKEDFQAIINKFSQWAIFLKKQAKSKDHILLLPAKITLDKLIEKVEIALEREYGRPIRLFVENKNDKCPVSITCDVTQVIDLLVTAVAHIANLGDLERQFLKIQLHDTQLQYEKSNLVDGCYPSEMRFPALAIVMSLSNVPVTDLIQVRNTYKDVTEDKTVDEQYSGIRLERINLAKKKLERIMRAHYGYLEIVDSKAILVVLPWDATAIREEMIGALPMESCTSEDLITPKEQEDSIMALMEFHDDVCQTADVDPGVIAEILLLLRRCYGFRRHPSGQLFYIRSAGIAKLVASWIFHSPKPIYATLLYDLVRYTRLPLSYIKASYDRGILSFVQNVLNIDQHQEMSESLFHIGNRLQSAIQQSHLSVLYIKLAERLYDLRNAAGYAHIETVKHMAKETLTVDIGLAREYLAHEIAVDLHEAATKALEYCGC